MGRWAFGILNENRLGLESERVTVTLGQYLLLKSEMKHDKYTTKAVMIQLFSKM
jgi:hypothetical protein